MAAIGLEKGKKGRRAGEVRGLTETPAPGFDAICFFSCIVAQQLQNVDTRTGWHGSFCCASRQQDFVAARANSRCLRELASQACGNRARDGVRCERDLHFPRALWQSTCAVRDAGRGSGRASRATPPGRQTASFRPRTPASNRRMRKARKKVCKCN